MKTNTASQTTEQGPQPRAAFDPFTPEEVEKLRGDPDLRDVYRLLIDYDNVQIARRNVENFGKLTPSQDFENKARMLLGSVESTIKYGELAVKSLLILGGGAAVALGAFAGSDAGGGIVLAPNYSKAIMMFGVSACAAVGTAGLSYIAQWFYCDERRGDFGDLIRAFAMLTWLVGLGAFFVGVRSTSEAIDAARAAKLAPVEAKAEAVGE